MNNSIFSKNRMASKINKYTGGINFNELSATSEAFMTDIRTNFVMKGGSHKCPCEEAFDAFGNNNVELALYIINDKKCCLKCSDSKGNTVLHNLISSTSENPECEKTLDKLIDTGKLYKDAIDIQNKDGETPILLAAKKSAFDVVHKLDKQGANKEIKDNKGFYLGEVESDSESSSESSSEDGSIMDTIGSILSGKDAPSESVQSLQSSQSVGDTEGLKNLQKIIESKTKPTTNDSDVQLTLDGVFDTESVPKDTKPSTNESQFLLAKSVDGLKEYFNSFIAKHKDGKGLSTQTVNNGVVWAPVRDRTVGVDSDVEFENSDDFKGKVTIPFNPFKIGANTATDVEPVSKSSRASKESEPSANTEVSDTDQLIDLLANRYSKDKTTKADESLDTLRSVVESVTEQTEKTEQTDASNASDKSVETSIDTDKLIRAIENIEKMGSKETKQEGGNKQKMMGYRNINLSENSESSIGGYSAMKENGAISDDEYDALYNESEYGAVNNELSRMMQRQRDNLHQQVLDMIMAMLNKGELVKDSEPIEASERNAKLIKAYVYRKFSEKNPQMGGLDKILAISKMSEQQISDIVESMPDLDDLEKTIQKHIEERKAQREKENKSKVRKSSKSKSDKSETESPVDMESTLDLSITESETPKKKTKTATKTKAKAKDTKKTSKTTKKSSKK